MKHTNLDRLHNVVLAEEYLLPRGAGKTFAECHDVAGVLEVTNRGGVFCEVVKMDRARNAIRTMIREVFPDHNIKLIGHWRNFSLSVSLPDGSVKSVIFIRYGDLQSMRGRDWPVVSFWDRQAFTDYMGNTGGEAIIDKYQDRGRMFGGLQDYNI